MDRLEGRKAGNLTSKDMLSAMAEAKDDHLRQVNDTGTYSYVNEMELEDTASHTTWCCQCFTRRRYARGIASSAEEYVCLVNCDELEHSNKDNTTTQDHNQTNRDNAFHGFEDDFVK